MGFSSDFKKRLLDQFQTGEYLSLHSADPADTGANELSGGSPAYARKAVTLDAAVMSGSTAQQGHANAPTFDVPAGSTVAYVGRWNGASGTQWRGSFSVTPETFGAQGTYQVDDTAHWDLA